MFKSVHHSKEPTAMKLLLKQISDHGPIALCDEAGNPLPNQMSVVINSRPDEIVTATVVFAVGDDVRLAETELTKP
jgi:hypothetical protein